MIRREIILKRDNTKGRKLKRERIKKSENNIERKWQGEIMIKYRLIKGENDKEKEWQRER